MLNGYTRKRKISKTDHFDPLSVAYVWLLFSNLYHLCVAYVRLHICGSYFDFTVVTGQLKHGREYVGRRFRKLVPVLGALINLSTDTK